MGQEDVAAGNAKQVKGKASNVAGPSLATRPSR